MIILTDIDSLYDKNPHEFSDAKLIREVTSITPEIRALAEGKGSTLGTGGMITKIAAAEMAGNAGFSTVIMNGSKAESMYDLFEGTPVGTLFLNGR